MTDDERAEFGKWMYRWRIATVILIVILGVKVYLA